jgi:hypothetical protein
MITPMSSGALAVLVRCCHLMPQGSTSVSGFTTILDFSIAMPICALLFKYSVGSDDRTLP